MQCQRRWALTLSGISISWFIALCAVFTLASCGGGGSSTDSSITPTAPSTVTGVIQDAAGQPVANVQVQIAAQTSMTVADGRFSFTVTSSSASIVMLIKKSGFATNAKDVPIYPGSTTDITVKIFADQVSTTFSASTGTTLALVNGASADIPANGLQTPSGAAFTGTVSVGASYFGPDTLEGVLGFAAPYEGTDAGVRSPLITTGVIEVKLTDASGNPLQLKSGSSATLTYPSTSVSAGASTIPMWYYDEANKIWVRDGHATKQPNGTYQANVTHFTLWNADFIGVTATIKGCLNDVLGKPVSTAGSMGLRGTGWAHVLSGRAPTTDGNFTIVLVPTGMPLELYSNTQPAAFETLAIPSLAPDEVRQLACVVVTDPPLGSTVLVTPPSSLFTTSPSALPVANAGTAQLVVTGATVTLDASNSTAPTAKTLSYVWTLTSKPAGSAATLAASARARVTFIADVDGAYVATLFVHDGTTTSSAATVTVTASSANVAPVANAGVAQNVVAGSIVALDGSASSDANSNPLTYAWALTSRPAGSSAALSSAISAKPAFTADVAGTYVASLTVNDGKVNSAAATVSITAIVANGGDGSVSTLSFPLLAAYRKLLKDGESMSFTLSGGTCTGTGTWTETPANTPATFDGKEAFSILVTIALTTSSPCHSAVISYQKYVDANYLPLGSDGVSVSYSVFQTADGFPTSVKVGDTGVFGTENYYTSSAKSIRTGTDTISYLITADTANTALVNLIVRSDNTSSTLTSSGQLVYRIDSTGTLTRISLDALYSDGTHSVWTFN